MSNIKDPNVLDNRYLNYAGLSKFWEKAKEYILSQKSDVAAVHAQKDGNDVVWVSVTNDGKNPTTYTISDVNLNDKLNIIDNELTEIKTTTGVVSITVNDIDVEDASLVEITVNSGDDGKAKGDVIIGVDETRLDTTIAEIKKSISDETTVRKSDVTTLAGGDWSWTTDADGKAVGNWGTAPAYGSITALSEGLVTAVDKISALISATEFVGVVSWDPANVAIGTGVAANGVTSYPITGKNGTVVPADTKLQNGDIVIFENKEYILDATAGEFVELGDTTAEATRLTNIEAWINAPIKEEDILELFNK